MQRPWRLFGAMAAIAIALGFGLSTSGAYYSTSQPIGVHATFAVPAHGKSDDPHGKSDEPHGNPSQGNQPTTPSPSQPSNPAHQDVSVPVVVTPQIQPSVPTPTPAPTPTPSPAASVPVPAESSAPVTQPSPDPVTTLDPVTTQEGENQ